MRIAFIRPLAAINRYACNVPLNYIHLAAYLRACGHQGDILDMVLPGVTPAAVDDFIRQNGIRVAGIGSMTCELPEALAEARWLKQAHPGIVVVMGGAHPSAAPEDCLSDGAADYVVVGEGEIALAQLLDALDSGRDPVSIPGIWAVRNGTVVRNVPAPTPDIEALPTPAYDLLDLEKYFRLDTPWHFPKSSRVVQMITSRGCPYRCSYCHSIHGKKYRGLDPDKVLGQIEWLARSHGVEEFLIVDDIFNFELERAKRICRGIVDRRLKVHLQFPNGLRGDRLDEELMALMAKAGTHFISIAIETASERYQKLIRKNLKVEKALEAAGWARRYGIEVCGFFMIGFPNETLEEAQRTIRLALQAPFDTILISVATPFKGTELRDDVRSGRFGEIEPEALDRLFPVVPSKSLPLATLRRLQRRAYWRFYLRPRSMWSLAKRLTNRRNLRKLVRAIRTRTIQDEVTAFN